jgi:GH25 family lysozyme M1 (1,4-beta-N-acetylmuramidase)
MRLSPRRRPTKALLLALLGGLVFAITPVGAGAVAAADSLYVANCTSNLRASASTSGTLVDSIAQGTTVTVTGSVAGGSWSATCSGVNVAGSTWYVITAVGGKTTSTLYGKSQVYAATGLFSLAPPPPPPGSYLEGIDVSHWQGAIDWSGVAYAGKRFAIMKATEGQTYLDAKYAWNHAYARAYGLRVGAYHFANPSTSANDAVLEADWFVQNMNIQPGDLNPALDLETSGGLSVAALQAWVGAWLNEVYAKVGMRPMIYTSPAFWRTYMGDATWYADHGYTVLWVAHWFVTSPSVPASNWGGHGWTFWQYTDCGTVLGIGGCVDLDRYNGTDLTKVTYDPDFMISTSPVKVSVKQGASTAFAINIARQYFTLPVTLSVTGLPSGATGALDAATITTSSTTYRITTSNTGTITPTGTYPLTITATGNGLTRTATATLVVTDGIVPTMTAPLTRLFAPTSFGSGSTPGRTGWGGSDSSGISRYALQYQVNGGAWNTPSLSSPTVTSYAQQLAFNAIYRFRVRATDGAGNTSGWAYGPAFKTSFTQQNSSSVHYGYGWSTLLTSAASGGSLATTKTAGSWATFTFTGSGISWVAYKGPNRGSAQVWIDGVLAATVSMYSTTYKAKQIVFAKAWGVNGTHTIEVVNLATAGHPRIDIDGFTRLVLT